MNFRGVTKSYRITFGAAEPNSISAKRNADTHWLLFYKIYETSCLFGKIDTFLKLNFNVTLLSLNDISEFKKKRKHFY